MPISFVGSKTFTHAATSAQSCSLTDLLDAGGASATLLQGDIVIVNYVIATDNINRTNAEMTPSGYTAFTATDLYANDSNDANQLVSYKFMGSTPDTTVSIPASNAATAGVAVVIHAFRGVDSTTPSDATPTTDSNINTGVANAPAIVPVTAGAWILACGGAGVAAGAAFTNPTGMSATTNHFRSTTITTTTTDANAGTALFTTWTSGSYDPAAFGGSTTTNTGSWVATTIALRPAANPIVGSSSGLATITGVMLAIGSLIGSVSGVATTAGTIVGSGSLIGSSSAVAAVSGAMTGGGSTVSSKTLNQLALTGTLSSKYTATSGLTLNALSLADATILD